MRQNRRSLLKRANRTAACWAAGALIVATRAADAQAQISAKDLETDCEQGAQASPFILIDSWMYPAVLRLYSRGYIDRTYTGLRPWTRASLRHALEDTQARLEEEDQGAVRGIRGTSLRDSLHLGSLRTCRALRARSQGGERVG